MSSRLLDFLLGLTPRERLLLGLTGLVLGLGLGFGLLLPLHEQRLHRETQLQEVQALERWIAERIAEKQSLNRSVDPVSQAPIGTSGIERGLIAARLRPALTSLASQSDGGLDLRFERVDFSQLGRWLAAAHPGWGYEITRFRLEALEGDPGRVAAWLSLAPVQP